MQSQLPVCAGDRYMLYSFVKDHWKMPVVDTFSPAKRSQIMSRIRAKDTTPEIAIRKGLHRLGFRYRLHDKKLPGKPDMVFPRYNSVIFVHGCFWHGHSCHLFRWPASNQDYWRPKIERTRARDELHVSSLRAAGWRVLIIWECAFRGRGRYPFTTVVNKASEWLTSDTMHHEIKGTQDGTGKAVGANAKEGSINNI